MKNNHNFQGPSLETLHVPLLALPRQLHLHRPHGAQGGGRAGPQAHQAGRPGGWEPAEEPHQWGQHHGPAGELPGRADLSAGEGPARQVPAGPRSLPVQHGHHLPLGQ